MSSCREGTQGDFEHHGVKAPVIALATACLLALAGPVFGQSYTLFGPPAMGLAESVAKGLSDDGQSAVGFSGGGSSGGGNAPGFRWTRDGGRVDFSVNGPPENSAAYGISGDGQWAVGLGYREGPQALEAFRYRPETGEFQFLGRLPGWWGSIARDASRDGSVVAGSVQDRNGNFSRAFRWNESGGMQLLGNARSSHFLSEAHAISGDGSLIVGRATDGSNFDAVVWRADGRGTLLPNLYTTPEAGSVAYAISANGRFIVGASSLEMVEAIPKPRETIHAISARCAPMLFSRPFSSSCSPWLRGEWVYG